MTASNAPGDRGTLAELRDHWLREISSTDPLQLPFDRPRSMVQPPVVTMDHVPFRIDTSLGRRVEIIANQSRVSIFTVLCSSWAIVLARWCSQDEVLVGVRWNHRRVTLAPAVERVAGLVPLRIDVDESMPVEHLLGRAEQAIDEAAAYAYAPIEEMLEALQRECRDLQLPRVMISLDDSSNARLPGRGEPNHTSGNPQFDLAILVEEVDGRLGGRLEYATEVFDRNTIQRMMDSWISLLQSVVAGSGRQVGQLELLTGAERDRVLRRNNATAAEYPRQTLIHELFEEQAKRAPLANALVCQNQVLTYAELNQCANRLAHYLRRIGVATQDRVGICLERGIDTVVSILGVLKAGAAYVPLDHNYPAERLAYLLKDAVPSVVLTRSSLRERLPRADCTIVALDEQWGEIQRESDVNSTDAKLSSDNIAYVIYTSGSTGQPKGVMVRHRNVVNYSVHAVRQFDIEAGQGSLIGTSMSFDLALTGLYPPLICGRSVTLCAEDEDLSVALLRGTNYAPVKLTPTHLSILSLPADLVAGRIRTMVVGGEPLQGRALRWWQRNAPGTRIFNHYGPTETTIGCAVFEVTESMEGPVPIGRPIANTQIYILNAQRSPVPVGVIGELYIGGDGVAAGYWNRPELTAQRFIGDPFSADPQARMYKTGDVGRWRSDGSIELLGRNDDQVKIRGFRVELGEIGAKLVEHPQVKDAVVLAREGETGDKHLVAYLTQLGDNRPSIEAMRAHLNRLLPDYMVPSAFVFLESFPLTENGKLDRRALPVPDSHSYARAEYEAPRTSVEILLAGLWRQLLGVAEVGRNDNFFELGGHSLLIVKMMQELRRHGLGADHRAIYDKPTLGAFATAVMDGMAVDCDIPGNLIPEGCEEITTDMLPLVELECADIANIVQAVPGGATNIKDIYPLAPLQEGILFHQLFRAAGGHTYVLPTLMTIESRDSLTNLISALQSVIDRHDILRTAVIWEHLSKPVQVVCRNVKLPMEEVTLDPNRDIQEQLDAWMSADRQNLDISSAPLLRLSVAKDPHGVRWFAILQTHHIVSDHESTARLLREVALCLQGQAQSLPYPTQYREHVAQACTRADRYDAEAFFRSRLGDVDEPTAPFGLLDVYAGGGRIEEGRGQLESDLATRVRSAARRLGVSPATLFHAAYALFISHTSGRDDIVFGTLLLGRMQGVAGAQYGLGMFINTLPLRLGLRSVSVRDLIERTRAGLVELLDYEQASLAVAQRCSGIGGSAPLFSGVLNYVHGTAQDDSGSRYLGGGVEILERKEWTNYPLVVSVIDKADTFDLIVQADRKLDPTRVVRYFHTAVASLVEALTHSPERPALGLSVMPERERRRVLDEFNETNRSYPRDLGICGLLEQRVREQRDSVAVIYGDESVTYGELNRRANRLAGHLRAEGLRPGEYVALLMQRCLGQVIAQIAVLKCGGVYVPVDPQLPAERQNFMIADCGARFALVAGPGVVPTVSNTVDLKVMEALPSVASGPPVEHDAAGSEPLPPAYVMYTSGSTGTPKGVVVPQSAVIRLAINNGYAQIGPTDCIAYCSNPAFDASTFEVWAALLNGARLLIVPQQIVLDAKEFAIQLEQHRVSVLWLTIGLFSQYIDALGPLFRRLRYVMTGGDVVDPKVIARLLRWGPPEHLLNAYGPTECTTFSTTYEVSDGDEVGTSLSIGQPIGNATLYILNTALTPVPIGAVGEIYIGGDGVALGYLNNPGLTGQRFIANPFTNASGARMYRTGDLGQWTENGNVLFLGRVDRQVKIRGFRIELAEIEAQLTRQAHVNEAVVLVDGAAPSQKRLVAYVTLTEGAGLTSDLLRERLSAVLPDYMVPSAFVVLPQLPLTPNGKLDRRALPSPDVADHATRAYEPAVGETEELVAGIWSELLHIARVGRRDHFFDLGGHSLLAMQVTVRVRSALSIEIPISDLFERPVLADFAAYVEALREEQFLGQLASGGLDIDTLLEAVTSMSEREVDEAIAKLTAGVSK